MSGLTAAYVRSILDYDPETGLFTWKYRPSHPAKWNTRYAGKRAGGTFRVSRALVYRRIVIDGRHYLEHRLAWLYMYGRFPPPGVDIDHEDKHGDHNRWKNLRLGSRSQNNINSRLPSHNTSGHKGVIWQRRRKHWIAQIQVGGTQIYLGSFPEKEGAIAARRAGEQQYFGAFAA